MSILYYRKYHFLFQLKVRKQKCLVLSAHGTAHSRPEHIHTLEILLFFRRSISPQAKNIQWCSFIETVTTSVMSYMVDTLKADLWDVR